MLSKKNKKTKADIPVQILAVFGYIELTERIMNIFIKK